MVRNFNIETSDYGWELEIKGFNEPYKNYESIEGAPISFGICVKKDSRMIARYDPFYPKNEAIKEANTLPIFLEEYNFYDKYNDYKFKDTFVNALIYIQNKYREYKLPKLEEIAKKKEKLDYER